MRISTATFFLVCFLLAPPAAAGSILKVPGNYPGIQEALDAAAGGDIVLVAPGEYVISEPLDFNRLHDPDDPASPPVKDVQVRSEAGPRETIIRMSGLPWDRLRTSVAVFEKGQVDITDPIHLLGYLFLGGEAPAAPFPECGQDASPGLSCEAQPGCR